jgi:hypothetical protein
MDNLGQKFLNQPIEAFIISFLLLVYLVLLVPLYIRRQKNEQQDQPFRFNRIPKSLESLLMNFGIITTYSLLMWILFYFMNRYGFSSVQSSSSHVQTENHLSYFSQYSGFLVAFLPKTAKFRECT